MSKKRAFVKYTKQGRLIPGSLIVTTRGGYPVDGLYTEVPTNICCDTDIPGTITTSPKGWVRYTKKGAIVPGSLVVGNSHPKDGVWKEVTIDLCCDTNPIVTSNWFLSDTELNNPSAGFITFPDFIFSGNTLDPNSVGANSGDLVGLYINFIDSQGVDRSSELYPLSGNNSNLTLTQNGNSVVYNCTTAAFLSNGTQIYFDVLMGSGTGSVTVTTPSPVIFNTIDPITLTIEILPPPPPPNLTLTIENSSNFDIASNENFTIEWWAKMTADNNHPRPWSVGSFPSAAHAVSIENGQFYYWINGSIVSTVPISSHIGAWTHFCIMRSSSNTITIHINGVNEDIIANSSAIPTQDENLYLGSEGNDSLQNGLMSNFRWNNTALYNPLGFTPPTSPLTSVAGTKLLIFQGTTLAQEITDNSGNSYTILNGTGQYSADNPFVGTQGSILFGIYPITSVAINGITWSDKNLDLTVSNTGTPLIYCANPSEWVAANTAGQPAYCYPNYDPALGAIYGALYNAIARNIVVPGGWSISSTAGYTALDNLFNYNSTTYGSLGGPLKEAGTTHWNAPNTGATNVTGFTGLPAGYVNNSGTYLGLGNSAIFWGTDYAFPNDYSYWSLGNATDTSFAGYYPASYGLSIRVYHY